MALLGRPQVEGLYFEASTVDWTALIPMGWTLEGVPLEVAPGRWGLELRPPPGEVPDPITAWELAARMREAGALLAEPLIATDQGLDPEAELEGLVGLSDEAPAETDWNLRLVRVYEAWKMLDQAAPGGSMPGAGIRVGQLDTGLSGHPEILLGPDPRVRLDLGLNLLEGGQPIDPLKGDLFSGHGTSTASVLMSTQGAQVDGGLAVCGVAPGVELVPCRITGTVVMLTWQGRMARAIEHLVDQGCHVITISLGGLGTERLRRAIEYAAGKGVIVCCAAGNLVRVTAWPANYELTIAVAACGPLRHAWTGSCRGRIVDVTAPGHKVWRAAWKKDSSTKKDLATVQPGSGTSYATPTVAGAAAMWLQYHGVAKLRERYPGTLLMLAFRQVLTLACTRPVLHVEHPEHWGAGVLDVAEVLATPLPELSQIQPLTEALVAPPSPLDPVLQAVLDEAEERYGEVLDPRHRIARFLGLSNPDAPQLEALVPELVYHLMTDLDYRERLLGALAPMPEGALEGLIGPADPVPPDASPTLRSKLAALG